MLRLILIYGTMAGAIVICTMILGMTVSDHKGILASAPFGYLVMLVALSLIFFAVKQYRDEELGGVIRFGPALGLGLAIASMAGLTYVLVWEIYLAATDYAFHQTYVDGVLASQRAAGVTGADYEKLVQEMADLKAAYEKPYFRLPLTFIEIFPVGVLVALVSAALLRNPKILPAQG